MGWGLACEGAASLPPPLSVNGSLEVCFGGHLTVFATLATIDKKIYQGVK